MVSDNGPQLASAEFLQFLQCNGVKHTLVPAYHPASNGAVERSVQIVKSTLKKHFEMEKSGQEIKQSTAQRLNSFLLTYRITPQSTVGRTPAELFLRRDLCTRYSLLRPELSSKIQNKQKKQSESHDTIRPQYRAFVVNEPVSIRNNFGTKKWEKGIIIKRLGTYWYLVSVGERQRKAHVEQLISRQEVDISAASKLEIAREEQNEWEG